MFRHTRILAPLSPATTLQYVTVKYEFHASLTLCLQWYNGSINFTGEIKRVTKGPTV